MCKLVKLILILSSVKLFSQVAIGGSQIHKDAQLELVSSSQGLLVPRVLLTSVMDASPLSVHVQGVVVYNKMANGIGVNRVVSGLYYNDGAKWILFVPNSTKIGDIKYSFSSTDHDGWYLLDGRLIATLPSNAQLNASSLGQTIQLIDATDRFLKGKANSDVVGSLAGSKDFLISQANLPNVTFTGSTSNGGSHTHLVDSYIGFQSIGLLSTSILTLFSIEQVAKDEVHTTNKTTGNSGDHVHNVTVSSNGLNVPVERVPSYMATNVFIYLGK
ncbi:hypothetical protein [Flavobacterium difficile]|uniref:Uncharacterized protein n=1 Tax=Flavobacterium difficile TaxID=2709659 RepID=A0ABX0I3I9_9FLAO|nr:hypothetical protein [Flavobacterium difficile]NHM01755.1 hypothetical protein [Flavobacterium difficile]